MGVLFMVFPAYADPELPPWLEDNGISVPPFNKEENRYPSINEIRDALDNMEECKVSYQVDGKYWDAFVQTPDKKRAVVMVSDFDGNETQPSKFTFDPGGDELLWLMILRQLSKVCGPLVICADADLIPALVYPETSPEDLLEDWYRRQEESWERHDASQT